MWLGLSHFMTLSKMYSCFVSYSVIPLPPILSGCYCHHANRSSVNQFHHCWCDYSKSELLRVKPVSTATAVFQGSLFQINLLFISDCVSRLTLIGKVAQVYQFCRTLVVFPLSHRVTSLCAAEQNSTPLPQRRSGMKVTHSCCKKELEETIAIFANIRDRGPQGLLDDTIEENICSFKSKWNWCIKMKIKSVLLLEGQNIFGHILMLESKKQSSDKNWRRERKSEGDEE